MAHDPTPEELTQPYRDALASGLPDPNALCWACNDPGSALDALAHSLDALTEGYCETIFRLAEEADRHAGEANEASDTAKSIGATLRDEAGDLATWIRNCARFRREREGEDAPKKPEPMNPHPEYDRFRGPASQI